LSNTPPHQIATPLRSLRNMKDTTPHSSFRPTPQTKRSSYDRNVAPTSFATSRSEDVKNAVANLARENRALKGALNNAVKRLSELEGEQECFLSEGVFDLVNSPCRIDELELAGVITTAEGAFHIAATGEDDEENIDELAGAISTVEGTLKKRRKIEKNELDKDDGSQRLENLRCRLQELQY